MALAGGGSRRKKKAREQAGFAERIRRLGPVPFVIRQTPQAIRLSRRTARRDRFRAEKERADFRYYLMVAKAAVKAGDCRMAKAAHDEALAATTMMGGPSFKKASAILKKVNSKIAQSCAAPKKGKRTLH